MCRLLPLLYAHIPPHIIRVLSDFSCVLPPHLAWGFCNSLRRKSVTSCKDPQVRKFTLSPSPPLFMVWTNTAAHWSACFSTNAACLSNCCHSRALQPCCVIPLCMTTPGWSTWFHSAWSLFAILSPVSLYWSDPFTFANHCVICLRPVISVFLSSLS